MDLVPASSSSSASGSMVPDLRYSAMVVSLERSRSFKRGVKSKCSLISMSSALLTTACFSCIAVKTTVIFAGPRSSPAPSNAGTEFGVGACAACAIVTGAVSPVSRRYEQQAPQARLSFAGYLRRDTWMKQARMVSCAKQCVRIFRTCMFLWIFLLVTQGMLDVSS